MCQCKKTKKMSQLSFFFHLGGLIPRRHSNLTDLIRTTEVKFNIHIFRLALRHCISFAHLFHICFFPRVALKLCFKVLLAAGECMEFLLRNFGARDGILFIS